MGKDIVCLEANTKGRDFIIGDIHGNQSCLANVINNLKYNDRLFIVGDLTDRGHDSAGVIQLVKENRDNVFSARGNHENQCLQAMECLERLALKGSHLVTSEEFRDFLKNDNYDLEDLIEEFNASEDEGCAAEYKSIKFHLKNDRLWLINLFCYEMSENFIRVNEDAIEYRKGSKIKKISDYMSNLPYIIHVTGERPFNVVHADMPFDNSELLKRIRQNDLQLTDEEKDHATWARGNASRPFLQKNKSDDVITYVGHNIIKSNDRPIVRRETNTVNIDVAAYKTDASLMVNHTDKSSRFIGKAPPKNLIVKQDDLNKFLVCETEHQTTKRKSTFDSTSNFFTNVKRRKLNEAVQVHIDVKPNSIEIPMDTDVEISAPKNFVKLTS